MPKNKYRIVTDTHAGYEAQVKFWFFPFVWWQISDQIIGEFFNFGVNTSETIAEAKAQAVYHALPALERAKRTPQSITFEEIKAANIEVIA